MLGDAGESGVSDPGYSRIGRRAEARDGALDRHPFCPLNHRRDDGAANQVAAIQNFFAPAPQCHFQEFVLVAFGKLPIHQPFDQLFNRRPNIVSFFGQRAVVR